MKVTRNCFMLIIGLMSAFIIPGCKKAGSGETAAETQRFKEKVKLSVIAFVNSPELDGRRTDPVSRHLESKLNIELELTGTTETDYVAQFSTMMAAGDLPDIIYLPPDYMKILSALLASKSIMALDPYLTKENIPYSMEDPYQPVMFEAYRGPAFSPDGKMYIWGMTKGAYDDGTMPSISYFLLWDAYMKAGHPKLDSYDDFLDVLEKMVNAEPRSLSGQKTYGLGGWFGQPAPWGEWMVKFGLTWPDGNEAVESTGFMLTVDTDTIEPINVNQLTDTSSNYWRIMRLYNRGYQRGLLDPDSFTQTSDMYQSKVSDARYMFVLPGWMAGTANAQFMKNPGNTHMYISVPSLNHKSEYRFGNMYRGERYYGVNTESKYKERCVALLDYVSSFEFSRMAYNGAEGITWDWVDGRPVPKPDYLASDRSDNSYQLKTGTQIYHHLCGYGQGTVDPAIDMPLDLYQFSPEAVDAKMNDTVKDFLKLYGQDSLVNVYRAATPVSKGIVGMLSFGELPDDMQNDLNALNAYVGKNFAKVLTAAGDAEFNRLRDEFIAGMAPYNPDRLFRHFYEEALSQGDQVSKLMALMKK